MDQLPPLKKKFFEHRIASSKESRDALKALAVNVGTLRRKHELSQAELAKRVGCSVSTIKHIECASCFCSLPVYLALCRALSVPKPALI